MNYNIFGSIGWFIATVVFWNFGRLLDGARSKAECSRDSEALLSAAAVMGLFAMLCFGFGWGMLAAGLFGGAK